MASNLKYPTNNDVDKVIKEFSEVVSPFVKDMKQWLEHKELQEENEKLREIVINQELLILNQRKLLEIHNYYKYFFRIYYVPIL